MVHFHFHIAYKFSSSVIHWLYSRDNSNIKLNKTSWVPTFPKVAWNCEMIYLSTQLQSNLDVCKRCINVSKHLWWLPLSWNYRLGGMLASCRRSICRKMKIRRWLSQNNFLLCVCLCTHACVLEAISSMFVWRRRNGTTPTWFWHCAPVPGSYQLRFS